MRPARSMRMCSERRGIRCFTRRRSWPRSTRAVRFRAASASLTATTCRTCQRRSIRPWPGRHGRTDSHPLSAITVGAAKDSTVLRWCGVRVAHRALHGGRRDTVLRPLAATAIRSRPRRRPQKWLLVSLEPRDDHGREVRKRQLPRPKTDGRAQCGQVSTKRLEAARDDCAAGHRLRAVGRKPITDSANRSSLLAVRRPRPPAPNAR